MSYASMPDGSANVVQRLNDILTDIKTLMDYLGRLDNGRLQAHFDDTRAAVTEAVQFRAVPPCHTYSAFLARLAWLGIAIRKGQWPADPMPQRQLATQVPAAVPNGAVPPGRPDEPLDDIPFLVWSRDFLAAVAAPATVESIEVTRAYVGARTRMSGLRRVWLWLTRRGTATHTDANVRHNGNSPPPPPTTTPPGPSDDHAGRNLHGEKLAVSVRWLEFKAITATLAALVVSTYALSGQSILDQKQLEATDYTTLDQNIEAIRESLSLTSDQNQMTAPGCAGSDVKPQPVLAADIAQLWMIAGHSVAPGAVDEASAARSIMKLKYYHCQQVHADAMLRATAISLQSWEQLITAPHEVRILSLTIAVPGLGPLFGDVKTPTTGSADLLEQSGGIAKAVLSAVTLYVMPCLYGLIGAAAATLRMLRRKVDGSTLTYTDRGRVRQDVLLGVMCGATIGLFAGYIFGANPTQGLGLSALALLAGYNVSGVFAFLDELSNRLFRPPAKTSAG